MRGLSTQNPDQGCAVDTTAQMGHNGGPDLEAEHLYQIIGPKEKSAPEVFDCGAPWTAHASRQELLELARVQGWIVRREQALRELRARRTRIMMRCVRRMRREKGLN